MLKWLAKQVNLEMDHSHYAFEGPRKSDLFALGFGQ
jgi:hypothetical protein